MKPRNDDNLDEHGDRSNVDDLTNRDLQLRDEDLARVSGGCRKAGGEQSESTIPAYKSIIVVC